MSDRIKVAYILSSVMWQVSILAGGATLTYLSGNWWWVTGAIILMMMGSAGFTNRLNAWHEADYGKSKDGGE